MNPLTTWVEISAQVPLLGAIVGSLLLIGAIIYGLPRIIRLIIKRKSQNDESQMLRNQIATQSETELKWKNAQEAYRHFLYNVSHEVSNPLQSIQTNLENMENLSLDEMGRWRQYHGVISSEIRRLIGLTENLRLLSRLETPDAQINRELVNIKGVIEDVMMAQFERAEGAGMKIKYSGPDRPARVLGDRDQLKQVLMNLVDNSIKYSRAADGKVIINVVDGNDRLCVRVIDNGIGIPKEDVPHIFDTVYQSPDFRRQKSKGSGLGLAIAKKIIEKHEGEIKVESQIGEGTTVSFDIPIHMNA